MPENNLSVQREGNIGNKIFKVFLLFFAIIILFNLIVLDFWWFIQAGEENKTKTTENQSQGAINIKTQETTDPLTLDSCGTACQKIIDERIKEQLSQTSAVASYTPTNLFSSGAKQANVAYVPLVTSGAVASLDWADVLPSEFYFDPKDYPGAKEFRFSAYLLSINNDLGMARLYDNTKKRWVYFSDIQTKDSSFTLVESKPLEILPGNNRYTIQLRSVNATQVQIKDAKLKVVF